MSLQCLLNTGGEGKGQAWEEREKEAGRSASTTLLGLRTLLHRQDHLKGHRKSMERNKNDEKKAEEVGLQPGEEKAEEKAESRALRRGQGKYTEEQMNRSSKGRISLSFRASVVTVLES